MAQIFFLSKFISFILFLGINVIGEYTDVVQTDKGKVRGEVLQTLDSRQDYAAFKGIPYAQPPIGYGRRFRYPMPAESWDEVLNVTKDPSDCAQWEMTWNHDNVGNEDCLYLNVFTPELNFTNPRPRAVMAYIHGGAFQFGSINSSELGPDFLVEKDVVVVAMNYRLGVFGFLAIAPRYFDANNGLRDQAEALRWIQRNIRKFGGDPDKVTIFGESAGAASVEYHKLSSESKGLFRASIAMSGVALNDWASSSSRESSNKGWSFVESLLDGWSDEQNLYEKMINISTDALLTHHASYCTFPDPIPFRPTIEDGSRATDPFISKSLVQLYKDGNFSMEPHMLGFMKNEGISIVAPYSILTDLVGYTEYLAEKITNRDFIRDIDLTQRLVYFLGDGPVYYYMNSFDYDQALHKVNAMRSQPGAGHGDDIAHIFWVSDRQQPTDPNSEIGKHRQKMVTMWTNFAKYLEPIPNNNQSDPILGDAKWKKSGLFGGYLDINKDLVYHSKSRPISRRVRNMEYELIKTLGKTKNRYLHALFYNLQFN